MKTWRTPISKKGAGLLAGELEPRQRVQRVLLFDGSFLSGPFSTVCSIVMLVPFLKIVLVRTGPSFWESPWLALALLGVMAACAAAMLVVGHFIKEQTVNITI